MGLRTINRGALGPRVGAREGIARSIAQHKRSENEGGARNPVKSGASVRSSRVGFASIAPFRARRDRSRLPQRPHLSAKDGRFRVGHINLHIAHKQKS